MLDGLMLGRLRIPVVLSVTALILVNLVPLAGVLWLGWRMIDVLMLFWMENVVIGVINVLRMGVRLVGARELKGLFLIPFFTVHYFGFCAGHGLFLLAFFGAPGAAAGAPQALGIGSVPDIVQALMAEQAMVWGLAGIAGSHLLSFLVNFLWGGEWRRTGIEALMGAPYVRIMILHVVIVLGAIVVTALGQPIYALVLLVALKIAVDAAAHLRERRKLGSVETVNPGAQAAA